MKGGISGTQLLDFRKNSILDKPCHDHHRAERRSGPQYRSESNDELATAPRGVVSELDSVMFFQHLEYGMRNYAKVKTQEKKA